MKHTLLALSAIILLGVQEHQAQVSSYSFSQSVGSYSAPSTGSFVGLPFQDDDVNPVSLPFNFTFNGTSYSSLEVASNGNLSFASLTGTEYSPLSDAGTSQMLVPMGNDLLMGSFIIADITSGSNTITNCSSVAGYSVGDVLIDYNFDFAGVNPTITAISGNNIVVNVTATASEISFDIINMNGYIKQSTLGIAPNRVCEFEYGNFCRYAVYDEVMRFKVRLYETSNKIEFIYGATISGFDFTPAEVGLKGNSNADFNSRSVVSPNIWNTSVAAINITNTCDFEPSVIPSNGLIYSWQPPTCTTPTLSVAQSNTVTCAGNAATLTASGATSYSWSTGSTTVQSVINPTTTTTYTLVGANGSCASTITVTHSVTPGPALTAVQSSTAACAGNTITLTASGAASFTWSTGDMTAQAVVSPTATTTYTLIGANGSCASTITVTHIVTPGPALTIASSNTVTCAGMPATLTASGAGSYNWSTGDNTAQSVISPTSTATYTLTGSNGGCTASVTITHSVNPYPVINVTQSPTLICPGQSATLSATGASDYFWSNGTASANIVINPVTTTTYVVAGTTSACSTTASIVQNVNACTGIAKNSADAAAFRVYPNPFNNSLNIAAETNKVLSVTIVDALGKTVYSAANDNVIDTEFLHSGMYFITLTTSEGSVTKKIIKQ